MTHRCANLPRYANIHILEYIIIILSYVIHQLPTHSKRVLLYISFLMNKIHENIMYKHLRATTLSTHSLINYIQYARTPIISIFGVF